MLQGSLLEQSKILKPVHSLLGQSVFILGPKTWQRLWKTYSERPDSCGPPEHLGIHRAQLETPYLVPPLCSTDLSNLPQTHIIIFLLLWSSKDSSKLQLKMEMVCSFIQFFKICKATGLEKSAWGPFGKSGRYEYGLGVSTSRFWL